MYYLKSSEVSVCVSVNVNFDEVSSIYIEDTALKNTTLCTSFTVVQINTFSVQ